MFDVLEAIYLRLAKLFAKMGYVDASGEASVPEDFDNAVPISIALSNKFESEIAILRHGSACSRYLYLRGRNRYPQLPSAMLV